MDSQNHQPPSKTLVSLAWISFAGTLLVLLLKGIAYLKTNSGGVLSDTLESLIDIISSAVTLRVMKAVEEPADEEHPYGHGKLEYFSVAFEGGLIALAAIVIGVGAIRALIVGSQLGELDEGLWILGLSMVGNALLAYFLYGQGKKYQSQAIVAKSKHLFADILTTMAVLLGLGLVKLTGLKWIDSLAALAVAIHLVMEGVKLVREAIGGLIDEVDVNALKALAAGFTAHREPGLIDIHDLKLIRSGRFHHVDVHLVVPEFWDISECHKITEEFAKKVISSYAYDGEVAFHIDPCDRAYCRSCDLAPCQVRQHEFVRVRDFTAESISKDSVKDS